MRRRLTVSALLLALALSGCGSTAATTAPISFTSPAISRGAIPALYTCDGKNISPPLEWGQVPHGTKELAVLLIHYIPVGSGGSVKISVAWAMAGIKPARHRLAAGEVPSESRAGVNENHVTTYSVCPPKGKENRYQFTLYAIPPAITVPAGFSDGELFNLIATGNVKSGATGAGAFVAHYKRS